MCRVFVREAGLYFFHSRHMFHSLAGSFLEEYFRLCVHVKAKATYSGVATVTNGILVMG